MKTEKTLSLLLFLASFFTNANARESKLIVRTPKPVSIDVKVSNKTNHSLLLRFSRFYTNEYGQACFHETKEVQPGISSFTLELGEGAYDVWNALIIQGLDDDIDILPESVVVNAHENFLIREGKFTYPETLDLEIKKVPLIPLEMHLQIPENILRLEPTLVLKEKDKELYFDLNSDGVAKGKIRAETPYTPSLKIKNNFLDAEFSPSKIYCDAPGRININVNLSKKGFTPIIKKGKTQIFPSSTILPWEEKELKKKVFFIRKTPISFENFEKNCLVLTDPCKIPCGTYLVEFECNGWYRKEIEIIPTKEKDTVFVDERNRVGYPLYEKIKEKVMYEICDGYENFCTLYWENTYGESGYRRTKEIKVIANAKKYRFVFEFTENYKKKEVELNWIVEGECTTNKYKVCRVTPEDLSRNFEILDRVGKLDQIIEEKINHEPFQLKATINKKYRKSGDKGWVAGDIKYKVVQNTGKTFYFEE